MKYTPILQTRKGEMEAIGELPPSITEKFLPLFEVHQLDYSYADEIYTNDVEDRVGKTLKLIEAKWGSNKACYIDLWWLPEETLRNGAHPYELVDSFCTSKGIAYIPVIYYDSKLPLLNAVKSILTSGREVCIRICDLPFPLTLDKILKKVSDDLSVSLNRIHLLIDVPEITESEELKVAYILRELESTTLISSVKRIVLAGSSFPENLSGVERNSIKQIRRAEWIVWKDIISPTLSSIEFGDYCISNPSPQEVDPRFMQQSASIRYTTDNDFLIVKGESVRKTTGQGWGQTRSLCERLVRSGFFKSKDFSWGDNFIFECSEGRTSTGNATTWRKVGVNHHISLVVDQLSTHFAS